MEQDIDGLDGGAPRAGPVLPGEGQYHQQQQQPMPNPAIMVQQMMQQMLQNMLNQMNNMFAQSAPGQTAGGSSSAFSPQAASGGGDPRNWQGPPITGPCKQDRSLANVRFDERAFRRIEKFTDKKDEWTEWRAQVVEAVRECDKTFADDLVKFEKKDAPIVDTDLTVVQQQLSATLQSRLINLTGREAFAIVRAAQGQGVEAWRQLGMRFDPQTDARFALLLIAVVSYKIGAKQDVQSGLVRWETLLLSLERDHNEKLSP